MNQDQLDYVVFKLWKTLSSFAATGPPYGQFQPPTVPANITSLSSFLNSAGHTPPVAPVPPHGSFFNGLDSNLNSTLTSIPDFHSFSNIPTSQPPQMQTSSQNSPFGSDHTFGDSSLQTPALPDVNFFNSNIVNKSPQSTQIDITSDAQFTSLLASLMPPQQDPMSLPRDNFSTGFNTPSDCLTHSNQGIYVRDSPIASDTSVNTLAGLSPTPASELSSPAPSSADLYKDYTVADSVNDDENDNGPEPVKPKSSEIKKQYDNQFLASLPPQLALKRRRARSAKQTAIIEELLNSTKDGNGDLGTLGFENQNDSVKRHRNTDAARRSRLRKALRMETLEKQVVDLQVENNSLREQVQLFETQKTEFADRESALKKQIAEMTIMLNSALAK